MSLQSSDVSVLLNDVCRKERILFEEPFSTRESVEHIQTWFRVDISKRKHEHEGLSLSTSIKRRILVKNRFNLYLIYVTYLFEE